VRRPDLRGVPSSRSVLRFPALVYVYRLQGTNESGKATLLLDDLVARLEARIPKLVSVLPGASIWCFPP
jgi:hypothetical protein